MVGVCLLQGLREQVSVADAPDVGEGDLVLGEIGPVHYREPVAGIEGVHVVEITVPGVDVLVRIPQAAHHRTPGEEIPVVRALHNGSAGQRRNGQGHGLQPAHRARAGGVIALEEQGSRGERVQVGQGIGALGRPEGGEILGAEAFLHYHHHVQPLQRAAAFYPPGYVQAAAGEFRPGLGQGGAQRTEDVLRFQRGVEFIVGEFVI